MAKQAGPVFIEGTIEELTFYKVGDQWYVRRKSSLTGKRVKKDPKFGRTMQSAGRLKRGSQLASKVYRSLAKEQQVYALFRELKSRAVLALKEGSSEHAVTAMLWKYVSERCKIDVCLPVEEQAVRAEVVLEKRVGKVGLPLVVPVSCLVVTGEGRLVYEVVVVERSKGP